MNAKISRWYFLHIMTCFYLKVQIKSLKDFKCDWIILNVAIRKGGIPIFWWDNHQGKSSHIYINKTSTCDKITFGQLINLPKPQHFTQLFLAGYSCVTVVLYPCYPQRPPCLPHFAVLAILYSAGNPVLCSVSAVFCSLSCFLQSLMFCSLGSIGCFVHWAV